LSATITREVRIQVKIAVFWGYMRHDFRLTEKKQHIHAFSLLRGVGCGIFR